MKKITKKSLPNRNDFLEKNRKVYKLTKLQKIVKIIVKSKVYMIQKDDTEN